MSASTVRDSHVGNVAVVNVCVIKLVKVKYGIGRTSMHDLVKFCMLDSLAKFARMHVKTRTLGKIAPMHVKVRTLGKDEASAFWLKKLLLAKSKKI